MRGSLLGLLVALLVGSGAAPARAQKASQTPAASSSPAPLGAFGSIRTRAYWWNWFGENPEGDYAYPASLIRLGLSRSKSFLDWKVELALPILLSLPESA